MASARKGPVAPESKEKTSASAKQSAEPQRGPTAVKGPQVDPSVMEDARQQGAKSEKVDMPQGQQSQSVDFIQTDSPSQPEQAVKQGAEGTPAQPFNVQEVRTTSTGAEPGGSPPTSRSPIPDQEGHWEPYPEVRFDPYKPQVAAQLYVQPSTGAVAEKLVGQVSEEDSQLRPAGSALVGTQAAAEGTTTESKSTSPEEPAPDRSA